MHTGPIAPGMRLDKDARPRLGFLYPRGGSAFEYYRFAEHFDDNLRCYVIGGMQAHGGEKTHYPGPLHAMGAVENLRYATRSMRPLDVHAAIWCSTSASFIGGLDWARQQAAGLGAILGAPASSTSLAYADAIRAMGIARVAVLASYPQEVTAAFRRFLGECGIEVTDDLHLDADRGEDAYDFPMSFLIEKAGTLDLSRAQALLVPDTAMAAFDLMRHLERSLGIAVLTANQVSIWQCLRLAGARVRTAEFGRLFAET